MYDGFAVLPFMAFNCLAIFFKDIKFFYRVSSAKMGLDQTEWKPKFHVTNPSYQE